MFNTGPVISRPIAALYIAGIFFFSAGAFADEASELGDKLLSAMGGADAWKDTKTVHSLAVNHHPQARLPYIQEYWYFTAAPRHVVKINNHDMQRMRSYTEALEGEAIWSAYDILLRAANLPNFARHIILRLNLLDKRRRHLLRQAKNGGASAWEWGQMTADLLKVQNVPAAIRVQS